MNEEFNILIIEDDEKVYQELQNVLAWTNCKIWRANNASEALKLLKESCFMAIITEIRISDMNGIELIKRIKKIDNKINIVVLTAYSFTESAVEALKVGAYAYLLKPLNAEEVKLVLQRAIENRRLITLAGKKKYYQSMSILDGLTGVYNHRHFHEMLEWQIAHLRRFPQSISLFIIDIDDFKKYNDTKGHLEGDKVLHNTAQMFVNSTRDTDMVFRYGGEEFAVILPQTPMQQAKIVGERLIEAVRSKLPVTVSIGMAVFPDNAQTKNELVGRADKALYQAKALGKNRFCIYTKDLEK